MGRFPGNWVVAFHLFRLCSSETGHRLNHLECTSFCIWWLGLPSRSTSVGGFDNRHAFPPRTGMQVWAGLVSPRSCLSSCPHVATPAVCLPVLISSLCRDSSPTRWGLIPGSSLNLNYLSKDLISKYSHTLRSGQVWPHCVYICGNTILWCFVCLLLE